MKSCNKLLYIYSTIFLLHNIISYGCISGFFQNDNIREVLIKTNLAYVLGACKLRDPVVQPVQTRSTF